MEIFLLFLCAILSAQAGLDSLFNKEEEECLVQTGASRQVVLQDKGYKFPGVPQTDSKFRDYLECYREKLDRLGKLFYTKDIYVAIPGYKTKAVVPGIFCTEEDLSGTAPTRQCAMGPDPLPPTKAK